MKLLSKTEIVASKNKERQVEIGEGAKLAHKIDVLRETAAKEETNLAKWREETMKATKKDIETLILKKTALQSEITSLTEQKRILQIPLDREWEKIRAMEDHLIKFGEELNEKHTDIQQKELDYDLKVKELKIEKDRIKDIKQRTEVNLRESELSKEESKQLLQEANHTRLKMEQDLTARHKELLDKEAEIAVRERENGLKQRYFDKIAIELNNKERRINDKYSTLLRTINRINK